MSLSRYLPNTRDSAEEVKRRAWRDHGMLVVSADDPDLKWDTREMLKQLGDRKYGPRKGTRQETSTTTR